MCVKSPIFLPSICHCSKIQVKFVIDIVIIVQSHIGQLDTGRTRHTQTLTQKRSAKPSGFNCTNTQIKESACLEILPGTCSLPFISPIHHCVKLQHSWDPDLCESKDSWEDGSSQLLSFIRWWGLWLQGGWLEAEAKRNGQRKTLADFSLTWRWV